MENHLAMGIGVKACEAGKKVMFTNASDLIDELLKSSNSNSLKVKLKKLSKVDCIVQSKSVTKRKELPFEFFPIIIGTFAGS